MSSRSALPVGDAATGAGSWSRDAIELLDALPVAIVVLSADGRVYRVNQAAQALSDKFQAGALWRQLVRELISEQPGGGLCLSNGSYINVSTSPLRLQPGQIVVLNDVTENRRLQEVVSQHRRLSAMGEVAARLAHQIRTPLATVTLYLSRLSKLSTDESQTGIIDKCLERVRHLNDIVSDMLRLARGGAGDTQTISVSSLLHAIEEQVRPALDKSRARLAVTNLVPGAHIRGNRTLLISMFENLVANALQATDENAELQITAAEAGADKVSLSVEDNGGGIPEADRQRIFEPFYTTRAQGTGLGLAVVRSIASDHRAQIRVNSSAGEGTRFDLIFHTVERARHATRRVALTQLVSGEVS